MKGIVFLDRDGTLIEDVGYISDPALLKEIPGAAESLRRLAENGYAIAVVSNQAGLAKGKIREEQWDAVHRAFVEYFRRLGVSFDAVEYCPHHADGIVEKYRQACGCRKPAAGLALKVLRNLALPPSCRVWVVGDKMSDISMGKRLRAETILVATGYGEEERVEGERRGEIPDAFLPSIREAAEWILSRERL
ncbi:MAG: HAD-IIIA family hydrolase [Deltaproteobacteria bacterium]|nr:HAD-IIIA family hydrolase [Deltaproteobacteria bacterium]